MPTRKLRLVRSDEEIPEAPQDAWSYSATTSTPLPFFAVPSLPEPKPKRRWKCWKERARSARAGKLARTMEVEKIVDLMSDCSASKIVGRKYPGISPLTRDRYADALGHFACWASANGRDLRKLHERDLHAFAEWLLGPKGFKPTTAKSVFSVLHTALQALRWAGASVNTPRRPTIHDPKRPHEHRIPDARETFDHAFAPLYSRVLQGVARESEVQTALAVALCYFGALRCKEAAALTWGDYAKDRNRLVVQEGKGGRFREVGVFPELEALLRRAGQGRRPESPILFSKMDRGRINPGSVSIRVGKWQRQNGLKSGAHLLRHLCGTEIARETGSLREAQTHLGHASITTTERYAKLLSPDDVLERVKSGLRITRTGPRGLVAPPEDPAEPK